MTIAEHADVVIENVDTVSRVDWLDVRRTGIGGSDVAAILGLDPRTSRYGLFVDKSVGLADTDNTYMEAGRELERPIGEWWARRSGLRYTPYRSMLRSKEWPWMLVNLDGVGERSDRVFPVEVKNIGRWRVEEWEVGPPPRYVAQVTHEIAVTGAEEGLLVALLAGQDLVEFVIERDEFAIADLVEAERAFWQDHVLAGVPPAIDATDSTTAALKARFALADGSTVELDPIYVDVVEDVIAAKAERTAIDARITAGENAIREVLGASEIGTVDGRPLVTYKQQTRAAHAVAESTSRRLHYPKKGWR